ncbi:MAG: lantibiotic dehydratase, partial [Solirubrobacterales bacterium]
MTAEKLSTDHLVELTDDWSLWRDFAVRSAGFPVEGLDVFGPDEVERLTEVAKDPAFQEAVAWQSRESLAHAVTKLATDAKGGPSRQRGWANVIASYWQRYCSKNDTIGFFGPLAWGEFSDDADEAISVRGGEVDAERVVHFETWAMEALAKASGIEAPLPMGPFPERALRPQLADTAALDRLELARDAVAAARGKSVAPALDRLDFIFEEVTGRAPIREEGDSGGGRTIAYLDCMRDLDVTLGPAVLDELRDSLPLVLYASRWWCGRVFDRGTALMNQITEGRSGPLGPLMGELMGAGFGLWNQMGDEQLELQRRWTSVILGDASAAEAFSDWTPAWHGAEYHSADLQIAAADVEAISRGEYLIVLGDFHGGDNPLAQGLFGLRHADPVAMMQRITAETGKGVQLVPPRHGPVEMRARSWPVFGSGDTVVLSGDEPTPAGTVGVQLSDLVVDHGVVTDRAETLSVPLAELLFLPIFVAALRSFDPIGETSERVQIGRLVVRRASWTASARELPESPEELAAWAAEQGLPRRAFVRSPLERKPRLVDFSSPTLCRTLARFIAPVREQAPDAPVEFTEMLPGPDECWVED